MKSLFKKLAGGFFNQLNIIINTDWPWITAIELLTSSVLHILVNGISAYMLASFEIMPRHDILSELVQTCGDNGKFKFGSENLSA